MPEPSSKDRPPDDPNQAAKKVLDEMIDETETDAAEDQTRTKPKKKNPAAVSLGRLGGKKGGMVRAQRLSAERRKEIATNAARARWKLPPVDTDPGD